MQNQPPPDQFAGNRQGFADAPFRTANERRVDDLANQLQRLQFLYDQQNYEYRQIVRAAEDNRFTAERAWDGVQRLHGRHEPRRFYTAKLSPYNQSKETFRAFLDRFRAHCRVNDLDEDAQKHELISNSAGAINHILARKDIFEWSIQELLRECRDRMCPDWTFVQLEDALYALNVQNADDPEAIMRRIEDVTAKADPQLLTREMVEAVQTEHFMRFVYLHKPMFVYVRKHLGASKDSKRALSLAKEYIREYGDQNSYFSSLITNQFGQLQKSVPALAQLAPALAALVPQPMFPATVQPGVPQLTGNPFGLAGIQTPAAAPAQSSEVQMAEGEGLGDLYRRYLEANENITPDEMRKRLNDAERTRREVENMKNPQGQRQSGQNTGGQRPQQKQWPPKNQGSGQNQGTGGGRGRGAGRGGQNTGPPPGKRYRQIEAWVNGELQHVWVEDTSSEGEQPMDTSTPAATE